MIKPSSTSPDASTSPADSIPSDTVAVEEAWRPMVIFAAASPALTSMLITAMRRPASSGVTVPFQSPAPLFDVHQLVTPFHEIADLRPVEFGVGAQRDPAVLAHVGRAIESGVFQEHGLHLFAHFDADRQNPLVGLQHRKGLGAHLKRGVAESGGLAGFRQG